MVLDGWSVYVHDKRHNGGAEVEVDTDTADHWIQRGWVEPVEQPKPARRATSRKTSHVAPHK